MRKSVGKSAKKAPATRVGGWEKIRKPLLEPDMNFFFCSKQRDAQSEHLNTHLEEGL